jgi:periplasmic protein TonB
MKALNRDQKADIHRFYRVKIQVGLIISLLAFIILFRVNISFENEFEIFTYEQETIEMEEIIQTEHTQPPPPPPRPPVPVAVPNDAIIDEDVMLFDSEFLMDEAFELPPPPAPVDSEEEAEPEVFITVETMPELIGGIQSVQERVVYPEIARRAGIEGRVVVQFVIDEQGRVTSPVVVRGIGGGCDEAAVEAVKQARFTPGLQRGRPVKVRYSIPVTFRLTKAD